MLYNEGKERERERERERESFLDTITCNVSEKNELTSTLHRAKQNAFRIIRSNSREIPDLSLSLSLSVFVVKEG